MRSLDEVFESEQRREDARVALLCSVFVNCHRDPKKPPVRPERFMPRIPPKSSEELEARILNLCSIARSAEEAILKYE